MKILEDCTSCLKAGLCRSWFPRVLVARLSLVGLETFDLCSAALLEPETWVQVAIFHEYFGLFKQEPEMKLP